MERAIVLSYSFTDSGHHHEHHHHAPADQYHVNGYQTTSDTYYSYQDLSPYDSYGVNTDAV